MGIQAPYLNYARTLFGSNGSSGSSGVPGVGTAPKKPPPTGTTQPTPRPSAGTPAQPPTFAQLQQSGVARPAPPPPPAVSAAPPAAGSAPPWLSAAMSTSAVPQSPTTTPQPMPGSPTAPNRLPPTPDMPTSAPQTGSHTGTGLPQISLPSDPKYPAPDATHPGGFGGYDPNKPPQGQDPNAWAWQTDGTDARTGQPSQYQVLDIGGKSTAFPRDFGQWTPDQWQTLFHDAATNPLVQGTVTQQRYQDAQRAFQQGGPQAAALVLGHNLSADQAISGNYPGGPHYVPPAAPATPSPAASAPGTTSLNSANPNDDLAQSYASLFGRQAQDIDDEYAQNQTKLEEDMARRGLADSSIRGGRLADLNVGKRQAKTDLATRLATELGTTAWQRQLGNKQFDLSKEMGEGNLSLDRQRVFNQVQQFAQQMGLSRDQFNEAMRQFDTTLDFNKNNSLSQFLMQFLPYLQGSYTTPTGGG